jgi:hypothetical protein
MTEPGHNPPPSRPIDKPPSPPAESGWAARASLYLMVAVLAFALALLWRAVRADSTRATVHLIDTGVAPAAESFHGFAVLEAREVSDGATAERLRALLDAPASYVVRAPDCPRFTLGVHTRRGARALDALVCLKCGMVMVIEPGEAPTPRVLTRAATVELRQTARELFGDKAGY